MAAELGECPNCDQQVEAYLKRCPKCGGPLWHKTPKEAFGSWKGLGIFDLIPGIRALPYLVRLILMIIVVAYLANFLVSKIIV